MDTHIKGPRGATAFGSVVSAIMGGAKFGDAALAAVELFRTDGAASGTGIIQLMPAYPGATAGETIQAGLAGGTPVALKKFPIFIQFFGWLIAGFDGTTPVFTLTETNLDDSGSVTIFNLASFDANAAAGKCSAFKVLTTDKKYKLTYTPATGAPTAGEGYFAIKVFGPGIQKPNFPAANIPNLLAP